MIKQNIFKYIFGNLTKSRLIEKALMIIFNYYFLFNMKLAKFVHRLKNVSQWYAEKHKAPDQSSRPQSGIGDSFKGPRAFLHATTGNVSFNFNFLTCF